MSRLHHPYIASCDCARCIREKLRHKPSKSKVQVVWNFAQRSPVPPMRKLRNGQLIAKGVVHELRPEGIPTEKIYCYGCQEYFKSWHHALWRHGLCKKKPRR